MTTSDVRELSEQLRKEAMKAKTSGMPDVALILHSASVSIDLMAATHEQLRLKKKLESLEANAESALERIDFKLDSLFERLLKSNKD